MILSFATLVLITIKISLATSTDIAERCEDQIKETSSSDEGAYLSNETSTSTSHYKQSLDDFSDIAHHLPPSKYRPHKRLISETDTQYEKRVRDGARRHARRNHHTGMLIRKIISNNQDPSILTEEIKAAIDEKRHRNTEKIKTNENELARMGISKDDFVKLSPDDPVRIRIMRDIAKRRAQRQRARRLRIQYENATEEEKMEIKHMAFRAGISLDELMRSHVVDPKLYTRQHETYTLDAVSRASSSFAFYPVMSPCPLSLSQSEEVEDRPRVTEEDQEDDTWLSLSIPGTCCKSSKTITPTTSPSWL